MVGPSSAIETSMFENLTDDNVEEFARFHYSQSQHVDIDDAFQTEFNQAKYIKRLIRRYQIQGILKPRLLLNHLITMANVFGLEPAVRILFLRNEESEWVTLASALTALRYMPNVVRGIDGRDLKADEIGVNAKLIQELNSVR
jgi:hypothetical protein